MLSFNGINSLTFNKLIVACDLNSVCLFSGLAIDRMEFIHVERRTFIKLNLNKLCLSVKKCVFAGWVVTVTFVVLSMGAMNFPGHK